MADKASFTVEVDTKVLEQIMRNTPRRIAQFMDAEAEVMVNDIKLSFGESPASPNNPPGVDMGALRASIAWEAPTGYRRLIMDGVLYGAILELGSTRHGYVWPWMGPAFERERRAFGDHAREAGLVKP